MHVCVCVWLVWFDIKLSCVLPSFVVVSIREKKKNELKLNVKETANHFVKIENVLVLAWVLLILLNTFINIKKI